MQCAKPINPSLIDPDRKRRVLAIVGDTQVGLWVVRSLARNGLTVHAIVNTPEGQSAHSRYTASAWLLEHRPSEAGFADEIEALVHRLDVGSIMPVSEGYHNALISMRERFEPGIHLFSPSRELFDKSTDKDYLQTLCVDLGIPVAKGMRLDELMEAHGGMALQFPLVLRTRRQNIDAGKMPLKTAYAEDKTALERWYNQFRNFADNVIVQEYHPGVEEHVQILMHDGQPVGTGDYIGEHHMPLAGGVTVQRVSCHHQPVIDDTVKLLQALNWQGIAGVQFHYDPATGKYIFLEINPRFSGGLPTVIMAGFEAPFLLWQSHFEPEKMAKNSYRVGLRSRILGGSANWLLGHLRGDLLPPGQSSLHPVVAVATFLWNCGPWTRDDSFLLSDIKPFLVDFKQMVKKLGARGHDIIGNPEGKA
ncbi:ATP-grasp domain-containing protein [Desulfoprunum benzoelyticum]|uniref:Putative ATP-grasp superfamily ATP-dependent carboligase n=1 Tax=Desulfoprunum benzoelyticum TaxID=1506996 RepID=A0A840UKX8_9BACT|nr:ATP-grasp domain-containing protein [Desulfoprunum benzoelyticum]MBB5346977.1 putative ATP-grasp superfamily ATP-dependent carboligase [Desulfoprunum benzoelyticum]MBM9531005.1 ATP-grasp domain-containing protein [Desulfoprunum benzoelyticum]